MDKKCTSCEKIIIQESKGDHFLRTKNTKEIIQEKKQDISDEYLQYGMNHNNYTDRLPINIVKTLIEIRAQSTNAKINKPYNFKDKKCRWCDHLEEDQQHLFDQCPGTNL